MARRLPSIDGFRPARAYSQGEISKNCDVDRSVAGGFIAQTQTSGALRCAPIRAGRSWLRDPDADSLHSNRRPSVWPGDGAERSMDCESLHSLGPSREHLHGRSFLSLFTRAAVPAAAVVNPKAYGFAVLRPRLSRRADWRRVLARAGAIFRRRPLSFLRSYSYVTSQDWCFPRFWIALVFSCVGTDFATVAPVGRPCDALIPADTRDVLSFDRSWDRAAAWCSSRSSSARRSLGLPMSYAASAASGVLFRFLARQTNGTVLTHDARRIELEARGGPVTRTPAASSSGDVEITSFALIRSLGAGPYSKVPPWGVSLRARSRPASHDGALAIDPAQRWISRHLRLCRHT